MRLSLLLLVTLVAALGGVSCQISQKIGAKLAHEALSAGAEMLSDELSSEKHGTKTEIKLGSEEED